MKRLQDLPVKSKTVLLRVDLNVPMKQGKVEDDTRIRRVLPTINYLREQGAKTVILSHFGRPKGEFARDLSLAPLANALGQILGGVHVHFGIDCVGEPAKEAVSKLDDGDVLLLENLRFHAGETQNDSDFSDQLAALGDYYVNDAFACSHRSHASIVGIAERLEAAAGLLMQEEITNLERVLNGQKPPLAAITGGSKVSTKLKLLDSLIEKMDVVLIGGAMANSFLAAQGYEVGKSLYEKDQVKIAADILTKAESKSCQILLPHDVIVAKEFKAHAPSRIADTCDVKPDEMILDIGPDSVTKACEVFSACTTVVWNGPLGAFETPPFDIGTASLARYIASRVSEGKLIAVAGGGDIVSALSHAGLKEQFTYISTAGGAFLEWLEAQTLPGLEMLDNSNSQNKNVI